MNSMILGGYIPSPKKQTEPITVEKNSEYDVICW